MNKIMKPTGSVVQRPPRKNFNKKGQMICGSLQITMGLLAIVLSSAAIPLKAGGLVYLIAPGFYCSVFMFIAGGLAIRSSITENTCPIIGCLVMSVFSMFAGVACITAFATAMDIDLRYKRSHANYDRTQAGSSSLWRTDNPDAALTVDILSILVGLTDFCVAIAQIVICSRTTCCAEQPPQVQQVIYIQQPNPTVVPPTGYVIQPTNGEAPPPYVQNVYYQ
jgi:hypothetical protein